VDRLRPVLTGDGLRVCYRYRMLRRRTAALATTLAMLALPATSLAQSAGDDQYQDPLANSGGGSRGHVTSTPGGGSGGGGSSSSGSSSNSGSGGGGGSSSSPSTSSNVPTGNSASTGTPTTGEAASGTPKGQLPRTGFDVIVSFELGLAMLLAGLVAHRMITLRERREN
jgi:hypothetical protein